MGAIIVRLADTTLERLAALAEALDADVDTVITLLLDRDPHTHGHRCPTCARMEQVASAASSAHEGQEVLFEPVG